MKTAEQIAAYSIRQEAVIVSCEDKRRSLIDVILTNKQAGKTLP